MKQQIWVYPFFTILWILIAGCGGGSSSQSAEPSPNTVSGKNYMPHATGSSWTYSSVSKNGTFSHTRLITESAATAYTQKNTNLDCYSFTNFVVTSNTWAEASGVLYDSDGHIMSSVTLNPPLPMFPSKTEIGTNETYASISKSDLMTAPVTISFAVNGFEAITVPAGTFTDALKITVVYTESDSSWIKGFTWTYWYADGVGLIKVQTSDQTDELLSYTIT